MKYVTKYDKKSGYVIDDSLVDDDYLLNEDETSVQPPSGLKFPYKFDANNQVWMSADPEKYEIWKQEQLKKYPLVPIQPSVEQQLTMKQSQQLVSAKAMLINQNQANAKLILTNQQQANQIKQLQQMVMNANQQQAVTKSKEEK